MMRGCQLFALAAATGITIANAPTANGQEFPEVTDRDYAIDLHTGNAIGSNEIVSMGGAAVAVARGSAGMTINPAAAAVRSQTSTGKWDWDAHIDWLGAVAGNDFDNNGIKDDAVTNVAPQITAGVVGLYKKWALGLTISFIQFESESPTGTTLRQSAGAGQLHLARSMFDEQLIVGGGIRGSSFEISSGETRLFDLASSSIEAGAVWSPKERNLRAGIATTLPASGETVEVETCDPLDCEGLILPARIEVPWSLTFGVGLRRAPTRWNRKVNARFVDERQLIVAIDARITGAVDNGYGVGQFGRGRLQPSGRTVAVSGRAGAEYTWLPGRLRIRGGSYWEPGRFRDASGDGVPGRVHVTTGADVRIYQFRVFDRDYRLRLSFTFDGARDYINSGLSIGFWR